MRIGFVKTAVANVLLALGALISVSSPAVSSPDRQTSCREYVSKKWGKLCKTMERVSSLRDELPSLPESAWFRRDQKSQAKEIDDLLDDVRNLLLSESSKDMLEQVVRLDEKLERVKSELAEANEKLVLSLDDKDKCKDKIATLTRQCDELRQRQLQFKRKILDELRSCGITVSETALEPFFSSATCNSIIDNAVVAKNMVAVVKNLEELMQGGDVGKARRYYGMYVVLVKLQIRCHRSFVNECDTAWIPKVDGLIQKIERDYGVADKGAADAKYTISQRKIYESNRRMNEKALRATRIYRESLERQRDAVAAKMRDAERMYEVALNTYETIGNAVALLETLRYGAEAFEAVMELDFPDLTAFNDAELVAEFQGITDRIKTNR